MVGAEAAFVAIELLDVVINILVSYRWRSLNLFDPEYKLVVDIIHAGLVVGVFIDFLFLVLASSSCEYYFPLRPFLMIFRNRQV